MCLKFAIPGGKGSWGDGENHQVCGVALVGGRKSNGKEKKQWKERKWGPTFLLPFEWMGTIYTVPLYTSL